MISFRISEKEYENLMELCASQGVRSMSDLARDAMCRLLSVPGHNGNGNGNGHRPAEAEPALEELHGRMRKLENDVVRLAHLVERT